MILLRNRSQRLSSHSAWALSSVKLQCARYWRNGQNLNSCSWWDVTLCWSKILIKQKGKGGYVTSEYLGGIKNETVAVKPLRSYGKCCCSLCTFGRKTCETFGATGRGLPVSAGDCWSILWTKRTLSKTDLCSRSTEQSNIKFIIGSELSREGKVPWFAYANAAPPCCVPALWETAQQTHTGLSPVHTCAAMLCKSYIPTCLLCAFPFSLVTSPNN